MCVGGCAGTVVDSWRGVAEEAIRVFEVGGGCGQEEPGIIMRVNLATRSTVVEKTSNCSHERSKHRDRIGLGSRKREN